ncbi:DUF4468 domain-containing protein [Flavobacterium sp. RSSA_27]|uniref:DUF4468 domain-containing protein n=1 Tax=Flavobacterium sp. RSSA_27 TaxID=3447667 RepID=UPI003F3B87F5
MLICFTLFSNAQESKFVFDYKTGLNDYIVTPVEGKTASEIYAKTLNWIKINYSDPSQVILSNIENEYIRFNALADYICYDSLKPNNITTDCYKVKYEIEISFKDGKYKFEIISLTRYESPAQYRSGGWKEVPIFSKNITEESLSKILFKKDGTIKKQYETITKSGDYFNQLNNLLLDYIKSNNKTKSDW